MRLLGITTLPHLLARLLPGPIRPRDGSPQSSNHPTCHSADQYLRFVRMFSYIPVSNIISMVK